MRLINARTLTLEEFIPDEAPAYAILSHRWGDGEVTFADIQNQRRSPECKDAYMKLEKCCGQALDDGLEYAWIDTCCIDKSSSAELSEAINSMFTWYKTARICYAFLNDVEPGDINDKESMCCTSFRHSLWFTRGWTLQELLAPADVRFYSRDWTYIGSKATSIGLINSITGIYDAFLLNADLHNACIAERMSWASRRSVTRKEDAAYSLLGIFSINMPLIYGEGEENAFLRLQEELVKSSNDESLFAWHGPREQWSTNDTHHGASHFPRGGDSMGLFATSPSFFDKSADITRAVFGEPPSFIMMNGKIQMSVLVEKSANPSNGNVFLALLRCRTRYDFEHVLAIPLAMWNGVYYRVYGQPKPMKMNYWKRGHIRTMTVLLSPHAFHMRRNDTEAPFIIRTLPVGYRITAVEPPAAARNDVRSHIISTELKWENLWKMEYSGDEIVRMLLLEAEGQHEAPRLVLALTVKCEPGETRDRMGAVSSMAVLGSTDGLSRATTGGVPANDFGSFVSRAARVAKQHRISLASVFSIAGLLPETSHDVLERYSAVTAVEELVCGPALVVDILDRSSPSQDRQQNNNQVIVGGGLAVIVSLAWYIDQYHPVIFTPPWIGSIRPRQLSVAGFALCSYSLVRYLWIAYGSLAVDYPLRKLRDNLVLLIGDDSLRYLVIQLVFCYLSLILAREPGFGVWVLEMGIVFLLVNINVPPRLMARPTRYWVH
ncbi:hypothetical protein S40288_08447 [Stachybotrys chartarum IBT 40288]|nr:hypothetical protein S40288_08447 [Stachybotrys chartarum IBT 40288]